MKTVFYNHQAFQEALKAAREKAAAVQIAADFKKAVEEKQTKQTAQALQNEQPDSESERLIELPNGKHIRLTDEQFRFVQIAASGKDAVLIGPAGTGKTTAQYSVTLKLLLEGKLPPLSKNTKFLSKGSPGIAIISYTNRAVNNIRKSLTRDLQNNCLTYHKLLEYEPVFEDITDPKTGEVKTRRMFYPARNRMNPLPAELKCIIIEESSMFSNDYFTTLMEACPHRPQIILLGDICQLPPIYDAAILGFRLCDEQTHTVELTQVHRQALESNILRLATEIRQGTEFTSEQLHAQLSGKQDITLVPFGKRVKAEDVVFPMGNIICKMIDANKFNIESDIILIPHGAEFSKSSRERLLSTMNINKMIASHLAKKRMEPVYHVIAGFRNHYFSVGDKIFYAKEEGYITKIARNGKYIGKQPEHASHFMDHFGAISAPPKEMTEEEKAAAALLENAEAQADAQTQASTEDVISFLEEMSKSANENDERTHQSSHIIDVQLADGRTYTLDKAAEINELMHGYALTVHKAQGCEWQHVVVIFHNSHQKMLQREMLYTAITRAKNKLTIFYEKEAPGKLGTFVSGVRSQKIKGNTLAEKAEYFKGKYLVSETDTDISGENGESNGES